MWDIDKQWISRVHQCIYKAESLEMEDELTKLKMLELKFFNLELHDEDYEEFDKIEEKLK